MGEGLLYTGDQIDISVVDLPPEAVVEVRAERAIKNHYLPGAPIRLHRSSARYQADGSGRLDLAKSRPIDGSYKAASPNGLFWSMKPVDEKTVPASDDVNFEAFVDGVSVAKATFELRSSPPDLKITSVPSLPGSYFAAHPEPGKHPVIILVDGTDDLRASREVLMPQLVSKGYSVLHFATYSLVYGASRQAVDGLPSRYVDVPIDRLQDAYDWLGTQPGVDADRVGLYGFSRNGAYVLLAATKYDWVKAVAGVSPSDVVWEGWGQGVKLGTSSSYSWKGQPFPYVPYSPNWFKETAKLGRREPARLRTPMDEGRWANLERVAAARIPVESYRGPLLLAGSEQDDIWSAGHAAQNMAERRAEQGLKTTLLVFPFAGHSLLGDGQNPTVLLFEKDEVRAIQAKAMSQTWQSTVDFFEAALKSSRDD